VAAGESGIESSFDFDNYELIPHPADHVELPET